MAKTAKSICDKSKVDIREIRKKAMKELNTHKKTASQDRIRRVENQVSY